jgi:hypothetical protein
MACAVSSIGVLVRPVHLIDVDDKFQPPRLEQYLQAVERLDAFARERHLAVRWVLDQQPLSIAVWGTRHPAQFDEVADVMGWKLDRPASAQIDRSVTDCIRDQGRAGGHGTSGTAGRLILLRQIGVGAWRAG